MQTLYAWGYQVFAAPPESVDFALLGGLAVLVLLGLAWALNRMMYGKPYDWDRLERDHWK